jgi:hypothetical protein
MDTARTINADQPDGVTGTEHEAPLRWADVLLAESQVLNPAFATPPGNGGDDRERLARLNRAVLDDDRTALCLSGGGIRSASFSIGVLQGLGQRGLLRGFDYLSTVSGGGFAGGWLSAWLHRAPSQRTGDALSPALPSAQQALDQFEGKSDPANELEPWPVARLRLYTRYLSPQTGLLSADFWGLIATMGRNILLNWAVLLPLLAAAMIVPRFQYALIHLLEQEEHSAASILTAKDVWALVVTVVAYGFALANIVANLPSYGNRGESERQFLVKCLLPLTIGTLGLTYYWAVWEQYAIDIRHFVRGGAAITAVIWVITGFLTGSRPFRPRTWVAAGLAAAGAALTYEVVFNELFTYDDLSRTYVTFALPLVMGTLLLHGIVFVGLAGHEMSAPDLEWWSRGAAWVFIVAAGWLVVCGIAFGVPRLVERVIAWAPNALHGASGFAAVLAAITSWLLRPTGEATRPSWPRRVALAILGPVTVVLIVAGLATFDGWMITTLSGWGDGHFMAGFQQWPICTPEQEAHYAFFRCHPADGGFGETVLVFVGLLALGFVTAWLVPANKFSLHDMYHHRLTRAYLGASREQRQPNRFTGFDPDDDLELAALAGQRPLHVVNTTLNMTLDARQGRQETRALSFTFSPLHAGSHALGAYRPSAAYAFDPLRRRGISLGSAVTISGGAASPQMGNFTSPTMAFLLALFNARLGVWLGNPGEAGRKTWRSRDPKTGLPPIVREMLGWTTSTNPYVFLSDGGHFDNLGLWEMVLRRVRHIVVVDGGCDPEYSVPDLAAVVRRARVDHGAEITFDAEAMNALRLQAVKPHVVTGTIRYAETPDRVGSIVYIKPALSHDEPVDVVSYRHAHPGFPHESTANQWFTEAQFESYRALGFHSVQAALADESEHGLGRMAARLLARQVQVESAAPA